MHKNHPLSVFYFLPLIIFLLISCNKKEENKGPVNPKTEKLNLPAGFAAEHLYAPGENGHGSWVAMAFDDKGRLVTSDQYGALYRLEIPPIGSDSLKPKVEKLVVGT